MSLHSGRRFINVNFLTRSITVVTHRRQTALLAIIYNNITESVGSLITELGRLCFPVCRSLSPSTRSSGIG